MQQIRYADFENAIETLGIISKTSKKQIKKKYIKLSKEYHPDSPTGSSKKFIEISNAYNLIMEYIENFKFEFDKEEFKTQYPFIEEGDGDWLYGI